MTYEANMMDARREGYEQGFREGIFESVQDGDCSVARGAEKLKLSVEEFIKKMTASGYTVPATT